ncbi:MAG: ribonuclease P protein component [Cytophagaceae bacterium]|jgi:ribonuclease P protein component|nr:ribonuclease P protein component [Cytophagaceae bacterium]
MNTEKNTFTKMERLCSRKQIEQLFAEGKSVSAFPFRMQYLLIEFSDDIPSKVLFSIPKKRFKRAVKRNLIRRRAKEAFRLNKQLLYQNIPEGSMCLLAFIYVDNQIHSYESIQNGILKAFEKLHEKELRIDS